MRPWHINMWEANFLDDVSLKNKINKIYTENYSCIILYCHIEFEYYYIKMFSDIVKAANENNLKIYAIVGCDNSFNHYPEETIVPNQIEIIYWPEVFFRESLEQFLHPFHLNKRNITSYKDVLLNIDKVDFQYHFIYLNGKGHCHRRQLIDHVAKHDLLKYSAYSWHGYAFTLPEHMYKFNWYDGKIVTLDEQFITQKDQGHFPKEYYNSFFQLVSETTDRAIFITEKTVAPLLLGKPFLVSGAIGTNDYLRKLGFQLYDELFDYSFDTIEDNATRYDAMCETIKNVTNIPLNELQQHHVKIKDKILYNRKRAVDLAFNDDFIPEFVKLNNYDSLLSKTNERIKFLKTVL